MFGRGEKPKAVSLGKSDPDVVSDESVKDDLGAYPENVSDQPSHQRAIERTLRAVSLVAVISGLLNVAFIMLIITLFPLQKVVPFMVTFRNQDDQVVKIEPLQADAQSMRFATEDSIRQYVSLRHKVTPDFAVMNAQWGPGSRVAAQTKIDAYQKFRSAADNELKQLVSQNYTRDVKINSVRALPGGTWQVDFSTVDHSAGQMIPAPSAGTFGAPAGVNTQGMIQPGEGSTQSWTATLRVAYEPQRVRFSDRLLNPLGFTVTDYSVTRRN